MSGFTIKDERPHLGSGLVNPPAAEPKPAKQQKPRKSIRPVSKKRAKENRQNEGIYYNFAFYNPRCAWCQELAEEQHHITGGLSGRSASLHDTDLRLALCQRCHHEVFDDALVMPRARQIALKLRTILLKFNRYSTKKLTMQDIVKYLDLES